MNRYIEEFLVRLHSEPELQRLVEQNDQRLLDAATRAATDGLEDRDFISLGL